MHCDDKRTIFVLKKIVLEGKQEIIHLQNLEKSEKDSTKKMNIQKEIKELRKKMSDADYQLSTMN